jgi:hypothetical protein
MRSSKFAFNIALREEIVWGPNARPLTTVSFIVGIPQDDQRPRAA